MVSLVDISALHASDADIEAMLDGRLLHAGKMAKIIALVLTDPGLENMLADAVSDRMLTSRDVGAGTGLTKTGSLNGGNLSLGVSKATVADITNAVANKFPDAATIKDALAGLGTFNSDMRWQDVLASRAVGTAYQNTSGKTILACPAGGARYSYCEGQISADGSTNWFTPPRPSQVIQADTSYFYAYPTLIVPNGHFYRLTVGNNYLGLNSWWEFR